MSKEKKEVKEVKDVFQEALKKAEELDKNNFTDGKGVDISAYYDAIVKIAAKNGNLKNEEAENIISDKTSTTVNAGFVAELEEKRKRIENFMRTYDPNKDIVKDLKLVDVDNIYAISNYLLNSYIQFVNEMKFDFEITKKEYKFLNKALTYEIEYNADEIFNYVELTNRLWNGVQEQAELNKAAESFTFVTDIKNVLILHHLIKDYKVKGIKNDFEPFRNILLKIAQINKLFNAFNIVIERIKSDREVWGSALDAVANEKEQAAEIEA